MFLDKMMFSNLICKNENLIFSTTFRGIYSSILQNVIKLCPPKLQVPISSTVSCKLNDEKFHKFLGNNKKEKPNLLTEICNFRNQLLVSLVWVFEEGRRLSIKLTFQTKSKRFYFPITH